MLFGKRLEIMAVADDLKAVEPVLAELKKKKIRITDMGRRIKDMVLVVLSSNFYSDTDAVNSLLSLIAKEPDKVIPMQLDTTPVPSTIKNALYSRNIIPAADREPELVADRIDASIPPVIPQGLLYLLIGGGVLLLIGCGVLVWLATRPKEPEPVINIEVVTTPTPEPEVDETIPVEIRNVDPESITDIVILGDNVYYFTEEDRVFGMKTGNLVEPLATRYEDEDGKVVWSSKDDGHMIPATKYDFSFLPSLTNLENLYLIKVEIETMPDLSGLRRVEFIDIEDCNIDNIDWLTNSRFSDMSITNTPVTDFSPINTMKNLSELHIDLSGIKKADFSGMTFPAMQHFSLYNGGDIENDIDLSALKDARKLADVYLDNIPISDLSFLQDKMFVECLDIRNCRNLKDVSVIGTIKNKLACLFISNCPGVTDLSSVAECKWLEFFHLDYEVDTKPVIDLSFLENKTRLQNLELFNVSFRDFSFLETLPETQSHFRLSFSGGEIQDYSGLSHIKQYESLGVQLDRDTERILPYIRDAKIEELYIGGFGDTDLSALPDNVMELEIHDGNMRNLSGIKGDSLKKLEIYNCWNLRSLDGLEAIPNFFNGVQPELKIDNCPRLDDYSALDGARLNALTLRGQYSIPDFSSFHTSSLRLEQIPGLTNLSCLSTLNPGENINIALVGLDDLTDLSVLSNIKGGSLVVPPQVANQAADLVKSKNFSRYEVVYPERDWQPYDGIVELSSLDELSTLSPLLLHRVERLYLVGDTVVTMDLEKENIDALWEEGAEKLTYIIRNYETDEYTVIEHGDGLSDISILSELIGLQELYLYDQPLENLNGIQNFTDLRTFWISEAPQLTDASALFACPTIDHLLISQTGITSIYGIQNLRDLHGLHIFGSPGITDLTPLMELDSLDYVDLSDEMEEAAASLEGKEYNFELIY